MLSFQYYLACRRIITEYSTKHILPEFEAHKTQRRKLMAEGKEKKEEYQWELTRWQNYEQLSQRICTANFFQPLKVGKSFFDKAD